MTELGQWGTKSVPEVIERKTEGKGEGEWTGTS